MINIKVDPQNPDIEAIKSAAKAIKEGKLVIFPTETVYGLAADPFNPNAVNMVYEAKGRDSRVALPLQIANIAQLDIVVSNVTEVVKKLGDKFWPGPLTLVLPKNKNISYKITGGRDSVGVRIPDNPIAQMILNEYGGPIIATSANKSGEKSPENAEEAIIQIGNYVSVMLDGGECKYGVSSTVVDLTTNPPKLLRRGIINIEQLRNIIEEIIEVG